ncbi:MAG TPA: hypothetical protein VM283_08475, partial [Armatimonadota bacterium]|nr:hypothetical protein [Armatimonadota bacterium]
MTRSIAVPPALLVALMVTTATGAGWCQQLAFVSIRDGNPEIYVVNADGTGLKRLTSNAAEDIRPAWSPDGGLIAFVSDRDGDQDIWVMTPRGERQTNITNTNAFDDAPCWSPDGARL